MFLLIYITENIVKYDAPVGEMRHPVANLEDISYDGVLEDSQMKGGLGQLVDGLYGDDDFQKQLEGENSGKCFVTLTTAIYSLFKPKFKAAKLLLRLNKKPSADGVVFIFISLRVAMFFVLLR